MNNGNQNVSEILYCVEGITSFKLSKLRLRGADLVIRPQVVHLALKQIQS